MDDNEGKLGIRHEMIIGKNGGITMTEYRIVYGTRVLYD